MTYPTFASGDVLTASDMNAVGLWLINETIVTGGTATSISFNNVFSSSYANYHILLDNFYTSAGAVGLNLRMRVGGADATGANYNSIQQGLTMAAAASNFTGAAATTASAGLYNSSTTIGLSSARWDVFAPNLAERTYAQIQSIMYDSAFIARHGMWQHDLATAYDGFTLICTNNITSIRVRIYGYKD